jgi:hypothetical protein
LERAVTEEANKEFVLAYANRHEWLLAADALHEQALAQYRRGKHSTIRLLRDGQWKSWDPLDRSIFLLGGFALENAMP